MPEPYVITYTGIAFPFLSSKPEHVNIIDIAHQLSLTNRWGGASRIPYSVAQHSILVSRHVPLEHKLAALLHDASESYLTDLPRPIKRSPGFDRYVDIERSIMRVIADKFGFEYPFSTIVLRADNVALNTEARAILPDGVHKWADDVYDCEILEQPWRDVESQFLNVFSKLIKLG